MVGDDAKADVGLLGTPVDPARGCRGGLEDRRDEIGVEDRLDALDLGEDPVEPGSGVDVPPRELGERTVMVPFILHEHQVPELHIALSALSRSTAGPVLRSPVEEDLRARATRSRLTHLPEVVLVEPLQTTSEQAGYVAPESFGLVVRDVDRDPELLGVETQTLGEQLPRVSDRKILEVFAEAEVPQHLEEGHVPRRGADHIDVDGAHTWLHRRRPGPRRRGLAQEVRLELNHARDREKHRRVVRHQTRCREREVTTIDEELCEGVSQLVRVHLSPHFSLAVSSCPSSEPCSPRRARQRSASPFSAPCCEGS